MRTSQWFVLAGLFFAMNVIFINLDVTHGFLFTMAITGDVCTDSKLANLDISRGILDQKSNGEITHEEYLEKMHQFEAYDSYDAECDLRGHVYSPFIYFTFFLYWTCLIMGTLEGIHNKRKKK
jgi:hypothetical protein